MKAASRGGLAALIVVLVRLSVSSAGVNPASPGIRPVDNVYGRNGIPNNNASAMCVACHTAVPLSTHNAHFTGYNAAGRTTQNLSAKGRTLAWTGSGGNSQYGNFTPNPPVSENTTITATELICESCHNLSRNVAGGNNLLESSRLSDPRPAQPNTLSTDTSTLCEGCHVSGTLPGHHPMTGDTLSDGTILSTTDTVFTRGFVSASTEMGGAGSGVRLPANDALPCLSCHGNGHDGQPGSGARILRRGYAGAATPSPPAPASAVAGRDATGIDRQHDIDPTGAVRLITNSTPLCDACHKLDD